VCHAMSPHLTIAGNRKCIVEWTNKPKHHGVAWSRPSVIRTLLERRISDETNCRGNITPPNEFVGIYFI